MWPANPANGFIEMTSSEVAAARSVGMRPNRTSAGTIRKPPQAPMSPVTAPIASPSPSAVPMASSRHDRSVAFRCGLIIATEVAKPDHQHTGWDVRCDQAGDVRPDHPRCRIASDPWPASWAIAVLFVWCDRLRPQPSPVPTRAAPDRSRSHRLGVRARAIQSVQPSRSRSAIASPACGRSLRRACS